ncbi:MAG: DUF58 domain-containing protein [Verrucomicrobiae bacterium]|nr:DUF58 domain-containing protein [Verrucomicrobiae bacterium]
MHDLILAPSLLRQLDRLRVAASHRARHPGRGERPSRARGHAVEFADHRDYSPGDDFRHLDWNLYGRLDRLYVKRHEDERENRLHIFLDASASMNFGSPSKFDLARRLAAGVTHVALASHDRVAIHPFPRPGPDVPDQASHHAVLGAPPGLRSTSLFFRHLSRLVPGGRADWNLAIQQMAAPLRRGGIAMILSDCLDPHGCLPALDALANRGLHVNLVQILAPEELEPATFGDLRLLDAETREHREITFPRQRLAAYRNTVERYCQDLQSACHRRGGRYLRVRSDAAPEDVLLRAMRRQRILE